MWYLYLLDYLNVISLLVRLRHPCDVCMYVWMNVSNSEWKSRIGIPKVGSFLWKSNMEPWIWKEGFYWSELDKPSGVPFSWMSYPNEPWSTALVDAFLVVVFWVGRT